MIVVIIVLIEKRERYADFFGCRDSREPLKKQNKTDFCFKDIHDL